MENVENLWKRLLNEDAEKSAFEPDTNRIWGRVSYSKNKKTLRPYLTHIAAAFAGILLTLSYVLFTQKNGNEPIVLVKEKPVGHDTVVQTETVIRKGPEKKPFPDALPKQERAPVLEPTLRHQQSETPPETMLTKEDTYENSSTNVESPSVPTATQIRTIHLADIEKGNDPPVRPDVLERFLASKLSTTPVTATTTPFDFFKSFSK